VPSPNTGFVSVAAGKDHSLGLKSDGPIVAWGCGYNDVGQCNVPASNSGFVGIAAGFEFSLGLRRDGSIVGWGYNSDGQLNVPSPNTGFVRVAAGVYHGLALTAGGACCSTNGTYLQLATQSLCDAQSGVFHGLGSNCGGGLDGVDCGHVQPVPTVSQAGLIVMSLILMAGLVAAAGGSILRKRRARTT